MKKLLFIGMILFTSLSYSQVKIVYLAAEMNEVHHLDDFSMVEMWGYGFIRPSGIYQAQLPGPVLEFDLGDTVEIHFHNKSPEDHTIHLHGLDVSQEEDGVPMTSFAVDPWDSTVYNFVAKNTGTFLYHCHVMTTLHLTMGMYGAIVVKNNPQPNLIYPGGPSFHREHLFLASDMDRSLNSNPLSPGSFNLLVMDYFMINGLSGNSLLNSPYQAVTAYPGDSVLLRLCSMGYSKTEFVFPEALHATAYMSDGRALPAPMLCDTLTIFPGERYEVLLVPDAISTSNIQVLSYESRNDVLQHINYISLNHDLNIEAVNQNSGFELYPNPASDQITFVTESPGSVLTLYTITGENLMEKRIESHQVKIDLSEYPQGIYLISYLGKTHKLIHF